MRSREAIRHVVDYIEDNLKNDMTLEEISRIAGYSMYHFHRIFQSYAKESVSEYIRKRRLTSAASEILHTDANIVNIALAYRFESHESFTRAFKKMFRVAPGAFRKSNRRLHIREKQRLTDKRLQYLDGGMAAEPRIVVKDEFTVVGLACSTTLSENKAPALWEAFLPRVGEVKNRVSPHLMMGVSEFSLNHGSEAFTYMACVPVISVEDLPESMAARTIPKREYVVVTHKGKLDSLGNAFDHIYGSWLPKSGYDLVEGDDFEIYDERFLGPDHEESQVDIYIPVQKIKD